MGAATKQPTFCIFSYKVLKWMCYIELVNYLSFNINIFGAAAGDRPEECLN